MRRAALYSSSRSGRSEHAAGPDAPEPVPPQAKARPGSRRGLPVPGIRLLWIVVLLLAAALAYSLSLSLQQHQRKLTQQDINAAVLKTMETQVLPSEYAKAYENIYPSVVRVVGMLA